MRSLDFVDTPHLRADLPPFRVGDTIRAHVKVREGEKPLSEVSPAAPEQVDALSRAINARFAANADLYRRGWFRFFQLLDDDHSGRIAYPELSAGLRQELGMSRKDLPEEELQALA